MEEKIRESRSSLIRIAAMLLMRRLPDTMEDYPKSVPKYVVKDVRKHNEMLRVTAINLREIADKLNTID